MNKTLAVSLTIFLCFASFVVGHFIGSRTGASMVLDNTEMVATWRESDWAVSSIHYAKLIQLIEAKNYDGAVAQACQSIAKDLKNIREIANVSNARQGPRIPKISEQVYESSCK